MATALIIICLHRRILGVWSALEGLALLGGVMSSWVQYQLLSLARGSSSMRPW